jgi:uncharacterized membrane protein (TIGR02234 family)
MSGLLRLLRGRWPLLALAAAALVLLASGRVWAEGTVDGLTGVTRVSVTGRDAQQVLPALALLAGAAAAVLAIGGPVVRRFSATALIVAGVGTAVAAASRAPGGSRMAGALGPAAARASGLTGTDLRLVSVSAWPWVATAGGVLLALAGLSALLAGRSWPDGGRGDSRPEQPADPGDDPAATWDALSRGEDPTAGRPGR